MIILDLAHFDAIDRAIEGSRGSGVVATASGGAFGNVFSTVSVFTGAYSISGTFKY